jgi:hypothetical protein
MTPNDMRPTGGRPQAKLSDAIQCCPVCDGLEDVLDNGTDNWGVCPTYNRCGLIGGNIFSGWRFESANRVKCACSNAATPTGDGCHDHPDVVSLAPS